MSLYLLQLAVESAILLILTDKEFLHLKLLRSTSTQALTRSALGQTRSPLPRNILREKKHCVEKRLLNEFPPNMAIRQWLSALILDAYMSSHLAKHGILR